MAKELEVQYTKYWASSWKAAPTENEVLDYLNDVVLDGISAAYGVDKIRMDGVRDFVIIDEPRKIDGIFVEAVLYFVLEDPSEEEDFINWLIDDFPRTSDVESFDRIDS